VTAASARIVAAVCAVSSSVCATTVDNSGVYYSLVANVKIENQTLGAVL